jgi:DNA modification methylase
LDSGLSHVLSQQRGCERTMIQTYCGDCLEELTRLHDHVADVILFDIPFIPVSATYRQVHKKTQHKHEEIVMPGDDQPNIKELKKKWIKWFIELSKQLHRILKKEGWCIIKADGITAKTMWIYLQHYLDYVSEIVWDKEVIGLGYYIRSRHELIELYRPKNAVNSYCRHKPKARSVPKQTWHGDGKGVSFPSVLRLKVLNNGSRGLSPTTNLTDHINETPTELWRKILLHLCPKGGLVVDPTMGTGSIGVACIQLEMHYFGVEIMPSYYAKAEQKLKKGKSILLTQFTKDKEEEKTQTTLV